MEDKLVLDYIQFSNGRKFKLPKTVEISEEEFNALGMTDGTAYCYLLCQALLEEVKDNEAAGSESNN